MSFFRTAPGPHLSLPSVKFASDLYGPGNASTFVIQLILEEMRVA
jgi:hypothetical protein